MSQLWRATPEWAGAKCFILAGGPSALKHDLTKLKGHKLIVINSSYLTCPWADFLIFSDTRWHDQHYKRKEFADFPGRIISASSIARSKKLLRMHRKQPPKLATDPGTVMIKYTTLAAAINLAVHLGVKKIVLVGADGKKSEDGRTHHHAPHIWKQLPGCWDKQKKDLIPIAKELQERGIECVNASPGSAWADLWPIVNLEDELEVIPESSN